MDPTGMFTTLTDDLLDLAAGEKGYERALYAQLEISLCCSFCCTCCCE